MAACGLTWPAVASWETVLWEWCQLQVRSLVTAPSIVQESVPSVPSGTLRGQLRQSCHLRLFHEYMGKRT